MRINFRRSLSEKKQVEDTSEELPFADDESTQDEQEIREEKRFKPTLAFKILWLLLVLLAMGITLLLSPLCALSNIHTEGAEYVSVDHILADQGIEIGMPLCSVRTHALKNAFLQNAYVSDVQIKRKWPNQLNLLLKERRPIGLVQVNESYLLLDQDGVILATANDANASACPLITGAEPESTEVGMVETNRSIREALQILSACEPSLLATLQEINVSDSNNVMLYTVEGIEIRFGSNKNAKLRMHQLSDILEQIILTNTSADNPIDYVDMRFSRASVIKMKYGINNNLSNHEENTLEVGSHDPGGAVGRQPLNKKDDREAMMKSEIKKANEKDKKSNEDHAEV